MAKIRQAGLVLCCKKVSGSDETSESAVVSITKLLSQHFHWKLCEMTQADPFYADLPVVEHNLHLDDLRM